MTTREMLIEQLRRALDEQGRVIEVMPAATEADIRWMIRFYGNSAPEPESTYAPSGIATQIGGNRVQLTKSGIVVRPQYDPRR